MVSSVLIVDDDLAFQALTARILTGMGIDVVALAADAATAVTVAASMRPEAAIVDIGLPDRDGIDLAYEIAALPWEPKVVLTSSDADAVRAIGGPPGQLAIPFVPKDQLTNGMLCRHLDG